jgi:arylsulfatase A-like enzyme
MLDGDWEQGFVMKAIMVMFDSLNRHLLPPYGCDWTQAPNFARLAGRSATFDCSYVCSMPCMPARRDFHTGRPNFLHCKWGPLEPFDDSTPELLRQAGVYTHLVSDHYHYWEDGGATYHTRYNSWEFFRGQEGDPWIGEVADPPVPANINGKGRRQDWVNRRHMQREDQQPQPQTFRAGLEFIRRHHAQDNWFVQIECFDPHEPFFSRRKYKDLYPHDYDGPLFDWPGYQPVTESPEAVQHCRYEYAALLTMCDAHLGDVLDAMDELDLWKDTMLVVWTDHGFLLGEHGCWAKNWPPLYEEVSHTPFFVWDPRAPAAAGQRRAALVQPAIDLGPTLLDFFGLQPTPRMLGRNLRDAIAHHAPVRDAAIFGYHGDRVNITDGRHVWLRSPADPANQPLYHYTLMPTLMRGFVDSQQLQHLELAPPFGFSRGCSLLRIPARRGWAQRPGEAESLLFDLQTDPLQQTPLTDPAIERRLAGQMARLMRECDAPAEQFTRMGLEN